MNGEIQLLSLIREKAAEHPSNHWVITQSEIAEALQVDIRTVRRWLRSLREAKSIIVEYKHSDRGHRHASIIRPTFRSNHK